MTKGNGPREPIQIGGQDRLIIMRVRHDADTYYRRKGTNRISTLVHASVLDKCVYKEEGNKTKKWLKSCQFRRKQKKFV